MALPPLPKKPKDEFSDKLTRVDNKAIKNTKQASKVRAEKMRDLMKEEGGHDRLMDFIFGKTTENPLEDKKDKKGEENGTNS